MIRVAYFEGAYTLEIDQAEVDGLREDPCYLGQWIIERCQAAREKSIELLPGDIWVEDLGLDRRITAAIRRQINDELNRKRTHRVSAREIVEHYNRHLGTLCIRNIGARSEPLIIAALKAKGFL